MYSVLGEKHGSYMLKYWCVVISNPVSGYKIIFLKLQIASIINWKWTLVLCGIRKGNPFMNLCSQIFSLCMLYTIDRSSHQASFWSPHLATTLYCPRDKSLFTVHVWKCMFVFWGYFFLHRLILSVNSWVLLMSI